MINAYRLFVVKTERKKPLRAPRQRWKNGNKMDSKRIKCKQAIGLDQLAQDRVEGRALLIAVMNIPVP
jgi:hypothetical protein